MSLPRDIPVIVHVGYHKTGTTWLQQAFIPAHPDLQLVGDSDQPMSDPFLRYLVLTSDRLFDADHAWALFAAQAVDDGRRLVVSCERLSGHPYSGGFDQIRLAERIRAVFPQGRLVVVVRDQVPMLESTYRQLIVIGYPGRFRTLVEAPNWTAPWFDLSHFEYDAVLRGYRRAMGADDRVAMLRYEALRDDPSGFVDRLCAFMGVRRIPPPATRVNRTISAEFLLITRLLNWCRRGERNRWALLPLSSRLIGGFVASFSRRFPTSSRQLLTTEEQAWIAARYADSNARLEGLLQGGAAVVPVSPAEAGRPSG